MTRGVAPRGLIVPVVTPLGRHGLDEPGMEKLLGWVLPHADAVLLGDPVVGEARWLAIDERKELLACGMHLARGRCTVLADVSARSRKETEELATWVARKAKDRCVLVDTPLESGGNRGLGARCRQLTELTGLELVVRNSPDLIRGLRKPFKRSDIRTAIVKRLCENSHILGVIHSGDASRARNYLRAARSRPEFRIYDGEEKKFLTFPSTSGVVAATANILPRDWARVVRSSINPGEVSYGDMAGGAGLADWAEKFGGLAHLHDGRAAVLLKKALVRIGIISSDRSVSNGVCSERQAAGLEELLESMLVTGERSNS